MPEDLPYLQEPNNANLTEKTPDKYFLAPGQDIQSAIDSLEINVPLRRKILEISLRKSLNVSVQQKHQLSLTRLKDLGYYHQLLLV